MDKVKYLLIPQSIFFVFLFINITESSVFFYPHILIYCLINIKAKHNL